MNNFSKRLKELRLEKNLTLVELAAETKLSRSAIQQWENNLRVPNVNAVITLAKFFGVTTDFLLGVED